MLLYGGGIIKTAMKLRTSEETAKIIRKKYFSRFKKVDSFIDKVKNTIKTRGFIFNIFGRRRRLGRDEAYKAVNALVQGVCADIVKEKMIRCYRLLDGYKSGLILQVHDELGFEISMDELHLIPQIITIMEDTIHYVGVKLSVDAAFTKTTWADKEELTDEALQSLRV
jgi:DNA polymerase-1